MVRELTPKVALTSEGKVKQIEFRRNRGKITVKAGFLALYPYNIMRGSACRQELATAAKSCSHSARISKIEGNTFSYLLLCYTVALDGWLIFLNIHSAV